MPPCDHSPAIGLPLGESIQLVNPCAPLADRACTGRSTAIRIVRALLLSPASALCLQNWDAPLKGT